MEVVQLCRCLNVFANIVRLFLLERDCFSVAMF